MGLPLAFPVTSPGTSAALPRGMQDEITAIELGKVTGGRRAHVKMVTVGDGERVRADKAAELVCGKGWTLLAGGCHAPAK